MAKVLKAVGLLTLLHRYNAAILKCNSAPLFARVDNVISGKCTLENPNDVTKLTIIQDSVTDSSTRDILPYTHYTLPCPNIIASQDYIHFEGDSRPLQAYTHYITPKRDVVTICSPYECIYLSGVTTEFYITREAETPKEECPENQFIFAYKGSDMNLYGACVTHTNPELSTTEKVKSSPSSFFYFSREETEKYHIIDHRFSPPKEDYSFRTNVYRVGFSPLINLVELEIYSDYISKADSSESLGVLGVTGTYYFFEEKPKRRYIVQTHATLYSLLDEGNDALSLMSEKEEYNTREWSHISYRRVVLQIFPDGFKLPSEGLPEAMRYSALYNKHHGYEDKRVKQTVTGAYALMRAIDYMNAIGGKLEKPMAKLYAKFGATYLFSRTNYLRNVGKEEERKAMAGMLKASGNKDWDEIAQGKGNKDDNKWIDFKDSEGASIWLGLESANAKDKESAKGSKKEVTENNGEKKLKEPKEAVIKKEVKEKETTSNRYKWWKKGRYVLLAIVVIVIVIFFTMKRKASGDQNQPSSALLNHQVQQII